MKKSALLYIAITISIMIVVVFSVLSFTHYFSSAVEKSSANDESSAENKHKGLPVSYLAELTPDQRDEMMKKIEKLRDAAERGDVATIKQLIKSGIILDIPASHKDERSALHLAAMNNHVEACKVLLDAGASPALRNSSAGVNSLVGLDVKGMQPIDYAVKNPELLEIFFNAGAPINPPPTSGQTLIQRAVWENVPESVELLAKRGLDLNSAIQFARNQEMLDLLIKLGAKPSQADVDQIARLSVNANNDITKQLKNHGYNAGLDTQLRLAIQRLDTKAVEDLLKRNADPNARSPENQRTPLHDAIEYGNIDIVKILIEAGADVNAQDIKMETPLMMVACLPRSIEIAKVLLEAGADPTIKTKGGADPIKAAKENRFLKLYKLLNEHVKKIQNKPAE